MTNCNVAAKQKAVGHKKLSRTCSAGLFNLVMNDTDNQKYRIKKVPEQLLSDNLLGTPKEAIFDFL